MLLINGHTRIKDEHNIAQEPILNAVFDQHKYEHISLTHQDISYFDYAHNNKTDDFLRIAEKMLTHDTLIFITPVYWYTMSAVMKTFIDRFSDLITIEKTIGRALAGKRAYLISSGHDEYIPDAFEVPFKLTFDYFSIDYQGSFYYSTEENRFHAKETLDNALAFGRTLISDTNSPV